MIKLLPNILTLFRLMGAPVLFFMLWQKNEHCFILFLVLVVSDFFDGKIARLCDATSLWGERWDPIADKILVLPLLGYFWHKGQAGLVPVVAIVLRELLIIYFRGIAKAKNIRTPSLMIGKLKMVFESIALGLFILEYGFLANIALWIAAGFAWTSLVQYARKWDFVFDYCIIFAVDISKFLKASWWYIVVFILTVFLVWLGSSV